MRGRPTAFARLLLPALLLPAVAPAWNLVQSPASATFNGIAIADEHLAIAVGNDGTIVHFVDGDSGTVVPSGTSEHLLDVYAVAGDFAVAAGIDVVLLWDGSTWSPLVENDTGTALSPVWASADRDLVLYGTLGQQFNFVCPHVPGAAQQGFCRSFGQEVLTLCGADDEITAVRRDGAIFRVDENLVELGDGFGPAFEPPAPLDLRAAWIAPGACGLGPGVQPGIWAIEGGDEVVAFDGEAWVDTGLVLPLGQQLVWLGGTGGNFVTAVGFAPAAGKGPGNDAVAWTYDGASWTQRMDLPPGTPGLTDIAVRLEYSETVFASGFEPAAAKNARPGLRVDILAAAEQGIGLSNNNLFPPQTLDLRVEKTLVGEETTAQGTRLSFALDVFNAGPAVARQVGLHDTFLQLNPGQLATIESFTCNRALSRSTLPTGAQSHLYASVGVDELAPNTSLNCLVVLVTSDPTRFDNTATVLSYISTDVDPDNNRDYVERDP